MKWRTININGFAEVGSDLVRYNIFKNLTEYIIVDPSYLPTLNE